MLIPVIVLLLQALVLAGTAVSFIVTAFSAGSLATSLIGLAVMFLIFTASLLAAARGSWRLHRWARPAAIAFELLVIVFGFSTIGGSLWFGLACLITAIAVILVLVIFDLGLEPQAEFDRGIDEGAQRIEGDVQRLGRIAKVQGDGKPLGPDLQAVEPVLDDDRHLVGIAVAQPRGHLDPLLARVEGDEEVVFAGQPVLGDTLQHIRDQPLHRTVHHRAIFDFRHRQPRSSSRASIGIGAGLKSPVGDGAARAAR